MSPKIYILFILGLVVLFGGFVIVGSGLNADEPKATQAPPILPIGNSKFLRKPDAFPALDDPPVVSLDEVDFLRDSDEVLGFVVDGQPRAYPVSALAYHHVVNDTVRGTHLTVTY